jgi:hypothetical protein
LERAMTTGGGRKSLADFLAPPRGRAPSPAHAYGPSSFWPSGRTSGAPAAAGHLEQLQAPLAKLDAVAASCLYVCEGRSSVGSP